MNSFFATIKPVAPGSQLFVVEPLSGFTPGSPPDRPHPPGYPPRPDQGLPGDQPYPDQGLPGAPVYPDHGLPGWQPRPDQGLPGAPVRPAHPIVIPTPPDLGLRPEHPIVIPDPGLPPGSGIIVPVPPEATSLPPPPAGTSPDAKPYVLWFGKGTVASVVYLPATATPK